MWGQGGSHEAVKARPSMAAECAAQRCVSYLSSQLHAYL
jgi:hypothetical protein